MARGATLWPEDTFLSPKTLSSDHIMKIEWLIADKLAVGSPVGAESAVSWAMLLFLTKLCHFCVQVSRFVVW